MYLKAFLVLIADFNAMQVTVFGKKPQVMGPTCNNHRCKPWDLTYDDDNDRLYVALTNGDVAVYDNYVSGGFVATPARTITPSDDSGAKVSVNIHGIALDMQTNTLVLSDVGSASDATDGAIFVISDASQASVVTVDRHIAVSMLGNPVDISLQE